MKKLIALIMLFGCGATQAALVDRGGGFIYDDVQDVTWLQDTNYAQTSGFDADGRLNWSATLAWADGLSVYDSVRNVTYDDWRLPTTLQPDLGCSILEGSTATVPSRINCTGSEMGHLFYVDGISFGSPGLFTNLQSYQYWSGTTVAGYTGYAWRFSFENGWQGGSTKSAANGHAWAVRDGDVAASVVPIPATVWLFGSGLGLLGWMRRKLA